jgi:hypothetical protein
MDMTHADEHLVATVLAKLATVGWAGLCQDPNAQSKLMSDFWATLPPEEAVAWRRHMLKPGWQRWFAGMTEAEYDEYRRKLSLAADSEKRSQSARRAWAKISKEERAQILHARAVRRWAKLGPDERRARMRIMTEASAARPHEQHVAAAMSIPRRLRVARAKAGWVTRRQRIRQMAEDNNG